MSKMYEQYKNKTIQNIAERRETETQPQTPLKKTMDNSAATMYNKVKENNTIKQPTALRDFASQWKQKNQGALKYAGDLAKKSINAGLEEAKYFMRDADEGTSFEKVQDASVKWKLAQDSNNPKLLKNALNEMIGHLSSENKDTYLKEAQPLQTYVDAKDEFDYQNNNYTTTESLDTTPDENVRNLQRELNEKGYTDKFGEKLKEDGIYGGKTAYANDKFNVDNSDDYNVVALNKNGEPFESPHFASAIPMYDVQAVANWKNGDNMKVASVTGTNGQGVLESVGGIKKTSDNGKLGSEDKKYSKTKQTMLKCLSANWYGTKGNESFQNYIHETADRLRNYDENSFNRAILLNNESGAKEYGHNAIMLLNKDNEGLVFSFYSTNSEFPDSLETKAEMRFAVLTENEVNEMLYEENPTTIFLVASDNDVVRESYNRFAYFDLPDGGYNMFKTAIDLYDYPWIYSLIVRQCNDIAIKILNEGGYQIIPSRIPNNTYKYLDTAKWSTTDN